MHPGPYVSAFSSRRVQFISRFTYHRLKITAHSSPCQPPRAICQVHLHVPHRACIIIIFSLGFIYFYSFPPTHVPPLDARDSDPVFISSWRHLPAVVTHDFYKSWSFIILHKHISFVLHIKAWRIVYEWRMFISGKSFPCRLCSFHLNSYLQTLITRNKFPCSVDLPVFILVCYKLSLVILLYRFGVYTFLLNSSWKLMLSCFTILDDYFWVNWIYCNYWNKIRISEEIRYVHKYTHVAT